MKRPLTGQNVVVTRPGLAGEELSLMLEGVGAKVAHHPAIAIEIHEPGANDVAALKQAEFLLLTSAQACTAVAQLNLVKPSFAVLAVGEQTAGLAKEQGWHVGVTSQTGGIAGLIAACESLDFADQKIVWPRSNLADMDTLKEWQEARAVIHDFVAYEVSNPLEQNPIDMTEVTALFVASPSAVKNVENTCSTSVRHRIRQEVRAFAIGRTTAKELRDRSWQTIEVASRPSNEGLLAAALEHLTERRDS